MPVCVMDRFPGQYCQESEKLPRGGGSTYGLNGKSDNGLQMPLIQQIVRGLKAYYTLLVAGLGQFSENALTRWLFHKMIDKISLIILSLKCKYLFIQCILINYV